LTNSFFKTITARPVSNTFRVLQVLFLVLAQVGAAAFYTVQPALAAPITVVDDAGADDEPGQKDLNALTVDYGAPGATEAQEVSSPVRLSVGVLVGVSVAVGVGVG
jgi:hypothetical protein